MANISARVSIRWLPDPPSEPTSTIVTTSPKLQFVDLRITALTEPPSPPQWAIAGKTVVGTPMRWVHEIDSRTDEPGEDSGMNTPLPNGDILEKGRMVDDEDGQMKDYEEVWRKVDIDEGVVVVLECDDAGARGRVVRVGGYCQGLVKVDGKTSCERRVRDTPESKWKTYYRYGDVKLPGDFACLDRALLGGGGEVSVLGQDGEWVTFEKGLNVGDSFKVDGYTWKVTEKSVW
ncbi:hypothetical protein L873DRAFT_1741357 [Choiromyces venosus 120613-1]|uniref:Protein HRI1 n=1 Tax=Choiromyces venosus 120613-1 TaxID=1336337 RepID=A0A3N4JL90_9PEZI|nr:hypothetical protein L873DRAFT_1741357 [Choiromyces venosus 120613-1]